MKILLDFINEVQRIDMTVTRYYSVSNNWFAEKEIPAEHRSDLQMKDFMSVNMSSSETIRECYNGAKMDLILLTDEQRKSVLKSLQSFNYKLFYSRALELHKLISEGDEHPMHIADFYEFLQNNFLCTIPENAEISLKFIDDLISEVGNKNSYRDALINYITENSAPPPEMDHDQATTLKAVTKDKHIVRMKMIYTYLKDNNFFDCPENDFLYWFGLSEADKTPKKIKWLEADSKLKNIIHHICGKSGEKYIRKAFIFNNRYTSTNYKKNYVGSELFHKIESYLSHAVTKI